jgi:Holliday junction resolvase
MDASLIHQVMGAMTVGMKGEVFAALVLSDLGCQVVNANAANANCKHVDLWVTRNNLTVAVQVKSTAKGSEESFIAVNDSLVADGIVKWFCVPVVVNLTSELESLTFVHIDKMKEAGKRFKSDAHRFEVRHCIVPKLTTLDENQWVSQVFGS